MERQPVLEGNLVRLRPLRRGDFDALFRAAADPLIWAQHPEPDRYTLAVFRRYFEEALASGGALVIERRSDGAVVGSSRFHGHDEVSREVEIGWTFLTRNCWGGDYNGEVKRLMIEHALRFVDTVVFLVGPRNVRSQKALEKIGALRAGSRTDAEGRVNLVYRVTAARTRSRDSTSRPSN